MQLVKKIKPIQEETETGVVADAAALFECVSRDCNKKYKNISGLHYHQSHAHKKTSSTFTTSNGDVESCNDTSTNKLADNPSGGSAKSVVKKSVKGQVDVSRGECVSIGQSLDVLLTTNVGSEKSEGAMTPRDVNEGVAVASHPKSGSSLGLKNIDAPVLDENAVKTPTDSTISPSVEPSESAPSKKQHCDTGTSTFVALTSGGEIHTAKSERRNSLQSPAGLEGGRDSSVLQNRMDSSTNSNKRGTADGRIQSMSETEKMETSGSIDSRVGMSSEKYSSYERQIPKTTASVCDGLNSQSSNSPDSIPADSVVSDPAKEKIPSFSQFADALLSMRTGDRVGDPSTGAPGAGVLMATGNGRSLESPRQKHSSGDVKVKLELVDREGYKSPAFKLLQPSPSVFGQSSPSVFGQPLTPHVSGRCSSIDDQQRSYPQAMRVASKEGNVGGSGKLNLSSDSIKKCIKASPPPDRVDSRSPYDFITVKTSSSSLARVDSQSPAGSVTRQNLIHGGVPPLNMDRGIPARGHIDARDLADAAELQRSHDSRMWQESMRVAQERAVMQVINDVIRLDV